jgi:hypothetical protein
MSSRQERVKIAEAKYEAAKAATAAAYAKYKEGLVSKEVWQAAAKNEDNAKWRAIEVRTGTRINNAMGGRRSRKSRRTTRRKRTRRHR